MTKVVITNDVAERIRGSEGPIELVDESGQTIGEVRRPPTDAEIARAKSRASKGGPTMTWDQLMAKIRAEVEL